MGFGGPAESVGGASLGGGKLQGVTSMKQADRHRHRRLLLWRLPLSTDCKSCFAASVREARVFVRAWARA